jgi:hypothetical protein
MVSDASEDIESARTRQEGVGTIFAFLFPNSDSPLVRRRHTLRRIVVFMLGYV